MKRKISLLLILLMLMSFIGPAYAQGNIDISAETNKTADFLKKKVPNPGFGTLAGEWTVLSLARSERNLPDKYIEDYYQKVEKEVQGKQGNLSKNKYTEYSRLIVALSSIGKDVTDVGGYNLLTPLADFDQVIKQGINGPIWALIAYDTQKFEIPSINDPSRQNSRDKMVEEILSRELNPGGWALMGQKPDPDITAMAIYSLVPYMSNPRVKTAVDKAVEVLSQEQLSTGGYITMGAENSESSAQVIIALTSLGIDPIKDARFIKSDGKGNQTSVVEALLRFRSPDGGFKHVASEGQANGMATDQALEALVAVKRFQEGKNRLFDMTDVGSSAAPSEIIGGFTDISNYWGKDIIARTKGFGIANGADKFYPQNYITRGEFAVGIVNGLEISQGNKQVNFQDVSSSDWYSQAIKIASSQGIIQGKGENRFDPNANIRREEAMAMLQRALKVKGVNTEISKSQIGILLRSFKDGNQVSPWARASVAYNIEKQIVVGRPEGIVPKDNIRRGEAVKIIEVAEAVK